MYEHFLAFLKMQKATTLSLGKLESVAPADCTYQEFARALLQLLDEQILSPIKKHGSNGKNPLLPNSFRLHKSQLLQPLKQYIQSLQLTLHPAIHVESYYKHLDAWERDVTFIQAISAYLYQCGLPTETVSAPERSYQLVGDEKWIEEQGGRKLLETVGLWELLKIGSTPDPLMLSVNPRAFQQTEHLHFIVENKATYYALEPLLSASPYTSLIYGVGWKVLSGIKRLPQQLHLQQSIHHYLYFGDLDHEGIAIWHTLQEHVTALPASAFYRALLDKPAYQGKATQRVRSEAVVTFATHLNPAQADKLQSLLSAGEYIPQEALTTLEIQEIWRESIWTQG